MKQEHTAFLYLPRMHRELLPAALQELPPEALLTLWPGLPQAPQAVYAPTYPWSPAQATAALADFERASQWGSAGSPIQSQSIHALKLGVKSPAEKENTPSPSEKVSSLVAALRMPEQGVPQTAKPQEAPHSQAPGQQEQGQQAPVQQEQDRQFLDQQAAHCLALKAAAQSNLILAWSQERRLLEMLALRRKVEKSQENLEELFSPETREQVEGASAAFAASEYASAKAFSAENATGKFAGLAAVSAPTALRSGQGLSSDDLALLPPWPLVVSAAAHFLEPDQALLTAEPELTAFLQTLPRCEHECPRRHSALACTQASLNTVLGKAPAGELGSQAQAPLCTAEKNSLALTRCWYYLLTA